MNASSPTKLRVARLSAVSCLALIAGMVTTNRAEAQNEAEEDTLEYETIIVTATRRALSVQEVPQSIQAIGGESIEDLAISNIEDAVLLVPNLNLESDRQFGGTFNIRGVGALSDRFTQFATVGLYLDEVPISDAVANIDAALYDIERVEVLKGPQGTLYGEASLAGTVRIIAAQPDASAFSAKGLAQYETAEDGDSSYRIAGAVNLPLIAEKAALRITASRDDRGGYLDAVPFPAGTPLTEDVNDRQSTYVRAALKLRPNDAISLTPSFIFQTSDYGAGPIDSIALPDLTGFQNGPGFTEDDLEVYALKADFELDWATLTSSTSYYDRGFQSTDDDILTNAIISAFFAPSPFTTQLQTLDVETFTQEIRLASTGDSPLDWLVGGFYRNRDLNSQTDISNDVTGFVFGDPRIFIQDNQAEFEQFAIFGELNYSVTDNFILTAGARWFTEDISSDVDFGIFSTDTFAFEETSREPSQSEDDILLKFAASYFPVENVQLYAQYSEGYRPGGVNDRVIDIFGVLTPGEIDALLTYNQDQTTNYEIGFKSQFFDNRLTLNAAGFYIDWDGIQVDLDIPAATGLLFTDNVGEGRSIGAELELIAQPASSLNLGVLLGYAKAETKGDTSTGAGVIPDGAELPFSPDFSGSFFVDYLHPISSDLNLRLRADASHTSDRKAAIDVVGNPGEDLASYQNLDLLLALESEQWSVSVYAKNLTDERAELNSFLFGDAIVGDTLAGFVRNRPRTFGVQLQADF